MIWQLAEQLLMMGHQKFGSTHYCHSIVNVPKFRKKYRIPSTRLPGWNYAGVGTYFITICTNDRIPWFGRIHNGMMGLSDMGSIVHECWTDIPSHFPHVSLDAYIVMPDHVHGIITIDERPSGAVETPYMASLRGPHNEPIRKNPHHHPQWQPGCLGSIIQQFKRACTHRIRSTGHPDFAWQPRFHDCIIRDDAARIRIRKYILNNPRT